MSNTIDGSQAMSNDSANDTVFQDCISRMDEKLEEEFATCTSLEQKRNFLLSLEISSFIESTVQFIIVIIHLIQYLSWQAFSPSNNNSSNTDVGIPTAQKLDTVRSLFQEHLAELKESYERLKQKQEGELSNSTSAPKYRNIISRERAQFLILPNETLASVIISNAPQLAMLVHNCTIGFANIYDFLKKIPLHTQYRLTKPQVGILLKVLGQELIPSWKEQLDRLNTAIFKLLAQTEPVTKKYREATGVQDADLTQNETYMSFVTWLNNEMLQELRLSD
ncbi:hypothetical protein HG535_0B00410 [Zygotorulaspora mrakii]|uniref:Uncharacterized protein n=1 Tax=Zygotorulaspora mrakii TaxID=42260 RepID=A0A7H9AXL8_ZYGMR|nr:uncharacterized protein HG535_0B00410 [Zygotorulaspora mrakii]QLG71003.1 hypothetical protein HG535_0B00410 [Zygotorulaspora mrakii]